MPSNSFSRSRMMAVGWPKATKKKAEAALGTCADEWKILMGNLKPAPASKGGLESGLWRHFVNRFQRQERLVHRRKHNEERDCGDAIIGARPSPGAATFDR